MLLAVVAAARPLLPAAGSGTGSTASAACGAASDGWPRVGEEGGEPDRLPDRLASSSAAASSSATSVAARAGALG